MTASAPSSPLAPRRAGLLRHRDRRLLLAGQAVSASRPWSTGASTAAAMTPA